MAVDSNLSRIRSCSQCDGFTLIELAITVAILSILAAIGISNIYKWVQLARIDEAKAVLNSASAECLQELRSKPSTVDSYIPESLDETKLSTTDYKIKDGKNKCGEIIIIPSKDGDNLSYEMGFKLVDNRIEKFAFPANDELSLNSCKSWAGKNCGATEAQLKAWADQAALKAAMQKCTDEFNNFRSTPPNGGTGSRNSWDSNTNTCTLKTWVFQGAIQRDEESFNAARERALGAKCRAEYEPKVGKLDGLFTYSDSACGEPTYFCSGRDLGTANKVDYDACKAEERNTACKAARAAWIDTSGNGQFKPSAFPAYPNAIGCPDEWKCNGTPGLSSDDYKKSVCGTPPPPVCKSWDRRGKCTGY